MELDSNQSCVQYAAALQAASPPGLFPRRNQLPWAYILFSESFHDYSYWSGREESNLRPSDPKSDALRKLSYTPMARHPGLEPGIKPSVVECFSN